MSDFIFGIKLKKEIHSLEYILDDLFPDWKEQTLYIWDSNKFEQGLDINKLYDLSKFKMKSFEDYYFYYYNDEGFIVTNYHDKVVTNIKPKSKFLCKDIHEIELKDIHNSVYSLPDKKRKI